MTQDLRGFDFSIKTAMLAYPSLFPTQDHAIAFIFCVAGNGYDWKGGALVERCDDEKHKIVEKMFLEGSPEEDIKKAVQEIDDKRFPPLSDLSLELEELLKKDGLELPNSRRRDMGQPIKVYPLDEYSHILKLPLDIRPDWLAGAEEAVRIIGLYPGHDNEKTAKNREHIPAIRARIKRLRRRQERTGKEERRSPESGRRRPESASYGDS